MGKRLPKEGKRLLGHGDIKEGTRPGGPCAVQGQKNIDNGGVAAGADIGKLCVRHDRIAMPVRRYGQQSGLGDVVQVMPGHIGPLSPLTVAADRAVDAFRICLPHGFVPDAETIHHAGTELFDDDVGTLGEGQYPVCGPRFLEVNLDASFSAVQHGEGHALPVNEWRGMTSRITAGPLDLDYVGACLRQYQCCQGPRQQGREVEDSHTFKKQHSRIP